MSAWNAKEKTMTTPRLTLADPGIELPLAPHRLREYEPQISPKPLERLQTRYCRLCSKPVLTFQVTPLGATLDFCSGSCVAEVRNRRLCFVCLKDPTPDLESYYCVPCSRPLGKRSTRVYGLKRTETAIDQARWLPQVYERYDPNAWKLRYLRKEDVA